MIKIESINEICTTKTRILWPTKISVEHANAVVKNHRILVGPYRGSFKVLQRSYKVIVHTTAYMLRNSDRGTGLRIRTLRAWDDETSEEEEESSSSDDDI